MRSQLLIQVMRICKTGLQTLHGSRVNLYGYRTNLPRLHCAPLWVQTEPPWFHCQPPLLPAFNFDFDADSHWTIHFKVDPALAFHFAADDKASQNDADPAQHNDKDQDPASQYDAFPNMTPDLCGSATQQRQPHLLKGAQA